MYYAVYAQYISDNLSIIAFFARHVSFPLFMQITSEIVHTCTYTLK